jgi:hypothetical protein
MAKGSSFERELCKKLSRWWTNGADDNVFWRSSNSGGRATVRGRRTKQEERHVGDIISIDPDSEPFTNTFVIEAKKGYGNCSIIDLVSNPQWSYTTGFSPLLRQAIEQATEAQAMYWMLIHQANRKVGMVHIPSSSEPLFPINQYHCKVRTIVPAIRVFKNFTNPELPISITSFPLNELLLVPSDFTRKKLQCSLKR